MGSAAAFAQEQPAAPQKPCQYTVTDSGAKISGDQNCVQQPQAPADTPASKKFPFPGEAGAMDAPEADAKKNAPANGGDSAAKKFPFPGETDAGGEAGGLKDAGSSGESSSSSSSSSSGSGDMGSSSSAAGAPSPDDVNSDTPPAPKRGLHKKPEPPPKDIATQEAEDLQVAGFYMNDKNWRGAYGRAQHAVGLVGDDADAHLALAEAARKLGKLDEAEKEYRKTLELDPVPKSRKAAEKALTEMTGGS